MTDEYCSVYLEPPLERYEVLSLVCWLVDGTASSSSVHSGDCEIYVDVNDEYDPWKQQPQARDQFLYYHYILEVTPAPGVSRETFIKRVARLLQGLWDAGCKAVAACDFEDQLPRCGGYGSQD